MELPINRHHIWYERRHYNTPTLRRLRNLGGFVVPTVIFDHRDMHHKMPPMKIPSKPIAVDIMDNATTIERTDRFSVVRGTAAFLLEQHHEHADESYALEALRLARHLNKQVELLSITPLPIEAAMHYGYWQQEQAG